MMKNKASSHSIPPPPRILLFGSGILAVVFFLAGFAAKRQTVVEKRVAFQPMAHVSPSKVGALQVFFKSEEGAKRGEKELKEKGYQTALQKTSINVSVPSGFIVVQDLGSAAAKPAADTLAKVYHFQVGLTTESKNRIRVQVGPVYQSQADADKMAQKLTQFGYNWKVVRNYGVKPATGFQITVSGVPSNQIENLKKTLAEEGAKVETIESH